MRKWIGILCLANLIFIPGCLTTSTTKSPPGPENSVMYTQRNMWIYKGVTDTVNYSVETKIPVNTKVVLDSTYLNSIRFHYADAPDVTVVLKNNSKYSGVSGSSLIDRYFGEQPVDLSIFNEHERKFISEFSGIYSAGISKEALLVGRGYPPAHRTSSTELDTWVYWRNRWKTYRIAFMNGRIFSRNDNHLGGGNGNTESNENNLTTQYRKGIEEIPGLGFNWYVTGSGRIIALDINEDSPAIDFVQQGDELSVINGIPISNVSNIFSALLNLYPGQMLEVTVIRDGESVNLSYKSTQIEILGLIKYLAAECLSRNQVQVAVIIESIENTAVEIENKTDTSIESWSSRVSSDLLDSEESFLLNEFEAFENFRIVDREQIEKVLDEQDIGLSGLLHDAKKIGYMLEASHILFVSYHRFPDQSASGGVTDEVSESLVEVETGKVVSSASKVIM